jgi:hypothetical protein
VSVGAAEFVGLVTELFGCALSWTAASFGSASAPLEAAVRNNRTAVEVSSRSRRIPDMPILLTDLLISTAKATAWGNRSPIVAITQPLPGHGSQKYGIQHDGIRNYGTGTTPRRKRWAPYVSRGGLSRKDNVKIRRIAPVFMTLSHFRNGRGRGA